MFWQTYVDWFHSNVMQLLPEPFMRMALAFGLIGAVGALVRCCLPKPPAEDWGFYDERMPPEPSKPDKDTIQR